MIIENNLKNLIDNDISISNYGYKKLFNMYLESKDNEEKKYLFKNISKVNSIKEEDLLEIIKYCSLYNRSYNQIKYSDDHTLFNSNYLNSIKILINVFNEKVTSMDRSTEYITESETNYDYYDLIIYYLKLIKDEDELYYKTYELFDIIVFNDLTVFYKIVYTFLTDNYFSSKKCTIINEMFHFKEELFSFLEKFNDITKIKNDINNKFVYVPTTTGSKKFHQLKELVEIRSVCCDKSITFLYDGYKIMNFYKENNFFDYSAVSLQFFKVIEIELKEKIINHAASSLNTENLFYGLCDILKLNTYHYDFINKLELGKIRYILKQVKSVMYDIREEIEINYFNKDMEIFYKRLVSLFTNVKTINFYLDILNYKVVEIYRNSAVHTGLLSYDRAAEAVKITNIFLKNIKELNYSFKLVNALNLKLYDTPQFILDIIKDKE